MRYAAPYYTAFFCAPPSRRVDWWPGAVRHSRQLLDAAGHGCPEAVATLPPIAARSSLRSADAAVADGRPLLTGRNVPYA